MNFGLEKQLDRMVETLALSALLRANPSKKIEKRLRQLAFPLLMDLEDGDIEGPCEKCGMTRCTDGTLTALTKNNLGIWCRQCQEYME